MQKVSGYTEQSDTNIAIVNQNKQIEEYLLRMVDGLRSANTQSQINVDPRWLDIAKTHFQEGFMAMNRAVFQPERIGGPIQLPPSQP